MALTSLLVNYVLDRKFLFQFGATLVTFIALRVYLFIRKRLKRYQLLKYYGIPGPEPNLIDGSLNLYIQDEAHYKADTYLHDKYGKIYGVYIGDEPNLNTSDLEILRKIFFEKMSSFKERTELFLKTPISHSILFAPYPRWKAMRKVMSPPFSSYTMRGSEPLQFVEDSIKIMLDYIDEKFKCKEANQEGKILLDIQDLMKATALHMISAMAISLPDVQIKEDEKYVKSLDSFLSMADKGMVLYAIKYPFIGAICNFIATNFEYDKTIGLIHKCLGKKIDQELKLLQQSKPNTHGPAQTKLINIMIRLHNEGKLTREEVIANADAVLFAGYDTTSTTLAYVFWAIGKYPEIQDKLRQDLLTYGTESQYLEQVLSETMRLYPTVISFTTRLATETVEIDGLVIPQGTKVVYNNWIVQRNPKIWPNPLKFDPERFRPGSEIHPCAFAPFGLGERKCLGYQLAKLEMRMIICDTLLRYKIMLVSPNELTLLSHANALTRPSEKVMVEMERLNI